MLRVDRPILLAVLAVIALASGLLALRHQATRDKPSPPRLAMGYYVTDARLTGTGPDGRVIYRLRAASAEQNLADGAVSLRDVGLAYVPATEVPWQLRAARGQIPPDRNIILLSGGVVAATRTTAAAPTLIRTEHLELDPDAFVASTPAVVAVERPRSTLHARGMRVYLKQDRLQLLTDVQGTFQP